MYRHIQPEWEQLRWFMKTPISVFSDTTVLSSLSDSELVPVNSVTTLCTSHRFFRSQMPHSNSPAINVKLSNVSFQTCSKHHNKTIWWPEELTIDNGEMDGWTDQLIDNGQEQIPTTLSFELLLFGNNWILVFSQTKYSPKSRMSLNLSYWEVQCATSIYAILQNSDLWLQLNLGDLYFGDLYDNVWNWAWFAMGYRGERRVMQKHESSVGCDHFSWLLSVFTHAVGCWPAVLVCITKTEGLWPAGCSQVNIDWQLAVAFSLWTFCLFVVKQMTA